MRILITGSRHWHNADIIFEALVQAAAGVERNEVTVVHGGARGADTIAGDMAELMGFNVEVHQANWSAGKGAGTDRNKEMVALGADICLAFPKPDSKGTVHCMATAVQAGINVKVFREEHNGQHVLEGLE